MAGSADEMELAISGSGDIIAEDFEVGECSAKISGSGSCAVNVTGELEARISGNGRVTYYGTPVIDAVVSGSGKVKKGDR